MTLSLRDAGFDPPIDYELEVESIALRDVVRDPERADVESTLSVRAHLPGIAEQLAIDATLTPFAVRKTLRAELSADEVTLAKLAPHLERAGLASTLRDGRLTVRLDAHVRADTDGTTRGEAAIEDLQLADGDDELAALARISVEGLAVPAAGDDVSAGEIVVRGTAVPVRRDATGALHFAGLRTLTPPPASPPPAPALETAPARGSVLVPIRLAVDALRVRDTAVSFVDETVTPPVRTATNALEVDVENLAFGGTEDAPESEASVRVRLRIDGVAEELGIRGTVTSRPGPLDVRAALQASGSRLAAGAFAPYLAAAGIEPQFSDGRLRATLEASAKATGDGGLTATARVADVSFQDGDAEPFVALDEVKADGIAIDGRGVKVASVVVTNPIVRAARDAEGALLAMGLRITLVAAGAPTAPAAPAQAEPTASTPIGIDSLIVNGAQLFWRDAAARSPVETVLGAEASLTGTAFGPGAVPTRLELTVRAGGALAEATIAGSVTLDPDDLRAQLRFDASGLVGGPLDGYLPAGNTFALQDGRLRAVLDARVTRVEAGGIGVDVAITDVDYRDGGAAEPLLALDAARLVAPRVDPANGVVMIRELSAAGTRIAARKVATGAIEVLGFAIATDAAPPPAAADAPATAPAPRAPTHRVVIEKLDVEVARARFVDESRGAGAPPIDARVRLSSAEQLVLLDDDEDELAPLVLALEGAVSPLVESIDVQLRASPWRSDPSLEADLAIRGLRGSAIPDVLPSLAERLGGDDLQDGSLTATLNASLSFQGAGGSGIDLSRGFGVEATLTDVAFRATPDGEVLAGVDEVFVDAPRITPDGTVLVSRLEIDGVRGHVRRSADGLHVLGLTVRPPAVAAETSAAVAATPATRPAPTGPEVRVDRILVHGLDFLFEDDAADPPMAIPLNGLDVEIDGFTTRMFTEPRAVRFAASLTGGDVELPKVSETRSIITGLLGAAAEVVTGGADTVELEQRPFLDEFAIQGQMAVYPKRKGRVRASVSALEMNTFRGPAARAGIEIDEGVMDAGVELAFLGDGAAHADARIVFDRLAVDEPPGGPISRFLKLPAPLNTVIFTLRDDTGRIEIPLSFQVADAGVGGEQIARESIKALGSVLTDAVRSAPFRVTGMVTGMLGIDSLFGGATSLEDERVAVTFAPAATNLPAAERARLRSIAELLEDDDDVGLVLVHAFGPKDYERADQLANPSPEQTRALVARLRQRRADLARERTQRGAEARALIATGRTDAAQDAVLRLQALDRGLGETELALDKTLELLRPGAARRADRRARDTALEIGNRRLEAVRRAILDLGTPALRERIELRRARPNAPEGDAGGTVIAIPKARQRG